MLVFDQKTLPETNSEWKHLEMDALEYEGLFLLKPGLPTWRIGTQDGRKWLITMVIVSPLNIGLWDPFQMALFSWLINGGPILTTYKSWDDPPYADPSIGFSTPWLRVTAEGWKCSVSPSSRTLVYCWFRTPAVFSHSPVAARGFFLEIPRTLRK